MSQHIDAIYDNGVFKPLTPLSLPDQARVKLTVDAALTNEAEERIAVQKATLQQRWRELDQLPQTQNNDGWSVRKHDELLYGGQT